MAWTTLKAAIQAVIKPNENKEITGQILQNVLVSIVDNLGALAGYKGIATPSTLPPSIAGYAFYVASQNGVYANFGGITLLNEVAILYNNGAVWSKSRIIKVLPTIGVNNVEASRFDIRGNIPLDDRKTGYVITYLDVESSRRFEVFIGESFEGDDWTGDGSWLQVAVGDVLRPDGDASYTTVDFGESPEEGLPATGDTQAILWGKVLYYLHTFFPGALEAIVTALSGKLDSDGDGSNVLSDHYDGADYSSPFPASESPWSLFTWFSFIRAKIDRLFVLAPTVLNITATDNGTTWVFEPFSAEEFNNCIENTLEGKTIKIHFIGYDGGGGVLLDIFYDAAFRYDELSDTSYIDCFELSRSFYIGGELRDTPMNVLLVGYLFKDGNGSDTTVNFAEAGTTALPASGETQSTLWGKVLRYFKTVIPALLEEKATQFPGICAETPILASDISINYSTRVLTINRAGGFHYFTDGNGVITKHVVTGSISFPAFSDTSGIWNFYFDNAGNPIVTQNPIPDFDLVATVYRILWNATLTGSAKAVVETFECHPNTIAGIDHTWKHKYGTIHVSGGDCVNNKLTTGSPDADGRNAVVALTNLTNLDDNLEYTITNSVVGAIWQQNLGNTTPALLNATNSALMKVRIQDAGGLVSYLPATRFPFAWDVTTNRAEYITAAGVRTLVNNGDFFVYYIYALQDPRNGEAIKLVSAITAFATLTNAQASSWSDIQATYPLLNDNEIRPLYRLIFATGASYDIGTKKARLQEVQDLRVTRVTATTASGVVLASGVTVIPTGNISSTNAQSALAELDTEKEPKYLATSQISRIEADGGLVRNKAMLYKLMQEQADLMPYCDLLYIPECGVKTRTVAATSTTPPYVYVPKLYDLIGSNDAAQTTESLQPFLGGNIAPNEKYKIKSAFGSGSFMAMTYAILNSKSYTYTFIVDYNNFTSTQQAIFYAANGDRISIVSGVIQIQNNGASVVFTCPGDIKSVAIGRMAIISVVTTLTNIFYYFNGELKYSIAYTPQPITWVKLLGGSSTYSYGSSFQYMQIHTKQLSTSEVSILHAQLRGYFPEIESITIGNQVWSTSNLDLACDAVGGVIPEVQLNTSGAELVAGGDFESGLIGTLLNSSGGATATWLLNTSSPISGTQDGLLSVSTIGTSNTNPSVIFNVNIVSGKPYIFSFGYKVANGTPIFIGVFGDSGALIGAPAFINLTLTGNGIYTTQFVATSSRIAIRLIFDGRNLFGLQMDNVSVKEAGWADLTVPAWCHYNNLTENGAVFGKLYNWSATLQLAANCPKGWRIPNNEDLLQLQSYLGGALIAGGKSKSIGIDYWATPNTGATNENGWSLLGGGYRDSNGSFSNIKSISAIVSRNGTTGRIFSTLYNITDFSNNLLGWVFNRGYSLRLIRNSPAGEQVSEVSTGLITTDIASAYKQVNIPFGYRIKSITCTSATNLTSVAANAYTAGGTLIQNIITGKTATANVPICYGVTADQSVQYADYTVRITATGVTGAGALFQIQIEKILL